MKANTYAEICMYTIICIPLCVCVYVDKHKAIHSSNPWFELKIKIPICACVFAHQDNRNLHRHHITTISKNKLAKKITWIQQKSQIQRNEHILRISNQRTHDHNKKQQQNTWQNTYNLFSNKVHQNENSPFKSFKFLISILTNTILIRI